MLIIRSKVEKSYSSLCCQSRASEVECKITKVKMFIRYTSVPYNQVTGRNTIVAASLIKQGH